MPLRRDALEEDPPGGEEHSRPPAGGGSRPEQRAAGAGSSQPVDPRRARTRSTVSAIRARVVASSSLSASPARLRTISPSAQKREPVAVAGDRPRCQKIVSTRPSTYFSNSQASRLLPMPPGPVIETQARPTLAGDDVEQVLEQAQLDVPADERRLQAAERLRPPRSATTRRARQAGTGAALPLSSCSPASSKTMADAEAACCVASPTSTAPGVRPTACSRAAVLTRSPATMPCPVAPRVTAACPVRTATRASRPSPSASTASTSSSPARTARSASSSWAAGRPRPPSPRRR